MVITLNIKINEKFLLLVIGCISLGAWMSNFMFNQYDTKAIYTDDTIYLLQIGSYDNKENMEESLKKLDKYLMEKENNRYYAYIALTKLESNYQKLKTYYEKQGFKIEQRQKILKDEKFKTVLEKYDILIEKATEEETLKVLEKELIEKYQEVMNGKN